MSHSRKPRLNYFRVTTWKKQETSGPQFFFPPAQPKVQGKLLWCSFMYTMWILGSCSIYTSICPSWGSVCLEGLRPGSSETNKTKFLSFSQLISLSERRVLPHSAKWQLLFLLLCRLNRKRGGHNLNSTRGKPDKLTEKHITYAAVWRSTEIFLTRRKRHSIEKKQDVQKTRDGLKSGKPHSWFSIVMTSKWQRRNLDGNVGQKCLLTPIDLYFLKWAMRNEHLDEDLVSTDRWWHEALLSLNRSSAFLWHWISHVTSLNPCFLTQKWGLSHQPQRDFCEDDMR